MSVYYTSFQIKNTTDVPIIFSVKDPDGVVLTVGALKPGKKSLQVAPVGASWRVERSNLDPGGNMDLPAHDRQTVITPDAFEMGAGNETTLQSIDDSINSEPIHYEAILKLETGSHTARINQLLVTPDGEKMITAGEDKTIRIWNVKAKKQIGMLLGQIGDGEEGKIQAMALTPDGRYIAAIVWTYPDGQGEGLRESDVRVFELATGNLQARHHYAGTLYDLDFSPNGEYLALTCNRRDSIRRSCVCLFESQEILQGFDTLPPVRENHVNVLYESDIWYMVRPAYVRFVPQEKGTSTEVRLVVATWIYNPRVEQEGEYTGRIYWYACSSEGIKEIQSCETAEIERKDPPGVHCIRPDSLAVSREFVITTAQNKDIKEFFCHGHHEMKLVRRVSSETIPARPVFSKDGSQLIVGQKEDSALVQIKVYNTAGGQFQLRSTYYGHDAETSAVALLEPCTVFGDGTVLNHDIVLDDRTVLKHGTAVSAGGDENSIHLWSPVHMEGAQIALVRGISRTVHAVGINEQEQIGIGNHADIFLDDGRISFQRIFDLRSLTLKPLPPDDYVSAEFQRSQTSRKGKVLEYMTIGPYPNLYLDQSYPGLVQGQGDWYYPTTFGFTKKGTVITGADDGRVRVVARERDGWQPMWQARVLVGHTARVLDHAASSKWLVTCGKDQVIRLWYLEDVEQDVTTDLEPALNLFVGMDDEWVIWSKSGYYTASQNGDRYLGYHINRGPDKEALFLSSDRFQEVFFRPDIIKAILIYGSEERVAAESQLSIKSINVAEILPPIIELDDVKEFEKDNQGFVTFTLTAESQGRPITRLRVLRNGRLLDVVNSVAPSGKIIIPNLPLLPGKNRFKIFAEIQDTQLHVIKSNPVEYGLDGKGRYEDQVDVANGILYILAIGVSKALHLKKRIDDLQEGIFDLELRFAHKDAASILDAFANDNKAFEEVERTLLVDSEATREKILLTLDEICQKIIERTDNRIENNEPARRDVLLVYLSGHGTYRPRDQQLYFWNYDYYPENPDETGLSFMQLGEKITSLPAELILMTDACYSGMAGTDVIKGYAADTDGIDPNELATRIYRINESDMYILNASRRSEYSWEPSEEGQSIEHGYFTQAILDTLASTTDRAVTMMSLIDQVQWRVTNDKQHPVCRIYGDLLPLELYKKSSSFR